MANPEHASLTSIEEQKDEVDDDLQSAMKRSLEDLPQDYQAHQQQQQKRKRPRTSARRGRSRQKKEVITIDNDSDEPMDCINNGEDNNVKMESTLEEEGKKVVPTDEVQTVEGKSNYEILLEDDTSNGGDNHAQGQEDDEVQAVGLKNAVNLPHMRQHCTQCTFIPDVRGVLLKPQYHEQFLTSRQGLKLNVLCCNKCYCYICDKPASECTMWDQIKDSKGLNSEWHCLASDRGEDSTFWTQYRQDVKSYGHDSKELNFEKTKKDLLKLDRIIHQNLKSTSEKIAIERIRHEKNVMKYGPFPPKDRAAKKNKDLTQCKKCKWFNVFTHNNFTKKRTVIVNRRTGQTKEVPIRHPVGFKDWCAFCGRVAHPLDFGKEQMKVENPGPEDVSLGSKVIPFRIKTRDPRKILPFKDNWDKYENTSKAWTFSAEEMEEEFIQHRVGKNPSLSLLLSGITPIEESKIPDSGMAPSKMNKVAPTNYISASDLEAIIVEDRKHIELLQELETFYGSKKSIIICNTEAEWDSKSKSGTITLSLSLKRGAFTNNSSEHFCFSQLLGKWYDIFPFKLSSLMRGIPVKALSAIDCNALLDCSVPLPLTVEKGCYLREISEDEGERLRRRRIKKLIRDQATVFDDYNKEAKEISSKHHFKSSGLYGGGVASNDCSFEGMLRRFFSEVILERTRDLASCLSDNHVFYSRDKMRYTFLRFGASEVGRSLGVKSTHRRLRRLGRTDETEFKEGYIGSLSCIDDKEHDLLLSGFQRPMNIITQRYNSSDGLLKQLENLGHSTTIDIGDGLNVELFDFQKQSLAWCLEREQVGLQNHLWAKVPGKENLFFSPFLNRFSITGPADIRGGIMAEMMGLGKTILSLSLILKNPAPALPLSGTFLEDWTPPENEANSRWPICDGCVNEVNQGQNKKTGSIMSRGTLVICHVSLVGQWIDEARSKLTNPGLVYPYHGNNRTRDAEVLAKNAITVTTYAILAKDFTYHKQKSKDPDYCAPLEQIQWWRVICDESHALKDTKTVYFKAISNLTAANKWCMTGTPMNQSNDLKGLLGFIGMENVSEYLTTLKKNCSGNFLFMFRNIMIRHSIKMQVKSSGVDLLSLPPKTEEIIRITLTKSERTEYKVMEEQAINRYLHIKSSGNVLSQEYLKLQAALLPLRVSCSGGLPTNEVDKRMNKQSDEDPQATFELGSSCSGECPVCLDNLVDPQVTTCKPIPHVFCRECIQGCLENSNACPTCRQPVKLCEMRKGIFVEDDEDEKPKSKKKDETIDDIPFKSKFERLLQELKQIRDNEPEGKSLVFSQFASTLQWIKQELPKHGFTFRTLSGDMPQSQRAKALRDFQNDPPTTIFLLSMRSGAVGINLTQANRVFLMEPAMNPALEAQAVGRVYRLGQQKSVKVIRFQMENSFETRLYKVTQSRNKSSFNSSVQTKVEQESQKTKLQTSQSVSGSGDKKKPAATGGDSSNSGTNVGNLGNDKATMLNKEYDYLFGVGSLSG